MNERIKILRKELKLSQDLFAERLGLTKNYISLIENGNRNLSEQSIKVLCIMFNVNEEWLRTGSGDMFITKTKDEQIAEMLGKVIKQGENTFRHRFISALANLDDSEWKALENIINNIQQKE